MRRRLSLTALGIAALLLAGCSSAGGSSSAPSTTTLEQTPTPTPTPRAAALVVSLHEVTVVDAEGDVLGTAKLAQGDTVEALVRSVLGEPSSTTHDTTSPVGSARWDGVVLGTTDGASGVSVQLSAAQSGAIELRSSDGIAVGMSRPEVMAAGAELDASWTDTDADVVHESFVSQRESVADTTSLTHPGQPGSIFVDVEVADGVVVAVRAPGDDFSDI